MTYCRKPVKLSYPNFQWGIRNNQRIMYFNVKNNDFGELADSECWFKRFVYIFRTIIYFGGLQPAIVFVIKKMLPTVQFGQQQSYQEKPKSSPRNPHRLSPHKCFPLISRRPALCPRTAVKPYDRRPLQPRARNHIKNCLKAGKRRGHWCNPIVCIKSMHVPSRSREAGYRYLIAFAGALNQYRVSGLTTV